MEVAVTTFSALAIINEIKMMMYLFNHLDIHLIFRKNNILRILLFTLCVLCNFCAKSSWLYVWPLAFYIMNIPLHNIHYEWNNNNFDEYPAIPSYCPQHSNLTMSVFISMIHRITFLEYAISLFQILVIYLNSFYCSKQQRSCASDSLLQWTPWLCTKSFWRTSSTWSIIYFI